MKTGAPKNSPNVPAARPGNVSIRPQLKTNEPNSALKLILARQGQVLRLWACRGNGRGCRRNRHRKGVPCEDCFGPLPEKLALAEVEERLQRGDA
jgi:hypothetical protein